MTIEASQFISQLNTAFPRATDLLKEGDDHIRLIKANLKNTFPNIDKSISITSDTLNHLNNSIKATPAGVVFNNSISVSSGATVDFSSTQIKVGNALVSNNTLDDKAAINFATLKLVFQSTFPVNTVMSCPVNPSTLPIWKGTEWKEYAQGRLLAGSGNGSRNYSAYTNYGSGSITVQYANMPSHSHEMQHSHHIDFNIGGGDHSHQLEAADELGAGIYPLAAQRKHTPNVYTLYGGGHSHNVKGDTQGVQGRSDNSRTSNEGGNQPINIEPLCVAVPFWIRTK